VAAMVLSVLLRFTDSDEPIGIFKFLLAIILIVLWNNTADKILNKQQIHQSFGYMP
jgi:hypothetical protein